MTPEELRQNVQVDDEFNLSEEELSEVEEIENFTGKVVGKIVFNTTSLTES